MVIFYPLLWSCFILQSNKKPTWRHEIQRICFRFHPIAALSELPNISVCSCLVKSPNTPTPDEQQTDFRFGATSLKLKSSTRVVWDVERTAAIHHSVVMMGNLGWKLLSPCIQTGAKLQGDHAIHHCRLVLIVSLSPRLAAAGWKLSILQTFHSRHCTIIYNLPWQQPGAWQPCPSIYCQCQPSPKMVWLTRNSMLQTC